MYCWFGCVHYNRCEGMWTISLCVCVCVCVSVSVCECECVQEEGNSYVNATNVTAVIATNDTF